MNHPTTPNGSSTGKTTETEKHPSRFFSRLFENDSTSEKKGPSKPNWRERWFKKVEDSATLYRGLLLLLLSIAIAFLVTKGLFNHQVEFDRSFVGRVAERDIRSPNDYEIEDHALTEQKRIEKESTVSPVYDYQADLAIRVNERIEQAFRLAQDSYYSFIDKHLDIASRLTDAQQEPATPTPETKKATKGKPPVTQDKAAPTANAKEGTSPADPAKEDAAPAETMAKNDALRDAIKTHVVELNAELMKKPGMKAEMKTLLQELRKSFNGKLELVIGEDLFQNLAMYHFSDALKDQLQHTIREVMERKIVSDRDTMIVGQNGEITIRQISQQADKVEYPIRERSRILDLKDVNEVIWRQVSTGNTLGERQRSVIQQLAGAIISPNIFFNKTLTSQRRREASESVAPVMIALKKGEIIVRNGELFTDRHLTILDGIQQEIDRSQPQVSFIGFTLFFLIIFYSLHHFASLNIRKYSVTFRDLAMMSSMLLLSTVSVKVIFILIDALVRAFPTIPPSVYVFAIPIGVGAAAVRLVVNSETALLYNVAQSTVFATQTENPALMFFFSFIIGVVSSHFVRRCESRTIIFFAGLRTSLVAAGLVVVISLVKGTWDNMHVLYGIIAALFSGVAMAIILTGLTPLVEFFFGYTTDMRLLELANLNHPLLKQLIVQAPGTYHHSVLVGSLADAAAEEISANPLLARVAGLYHDIGKTKNPQYFAENQSAGNNPHDKLAPSMSVLVLQSHVKEGKELARQYNLGEMILDVIEQHHGSSLIRFFYQKAVEQEGEKGQPVNETDFRYGGQKPQTREAALVMLADSVEAATRSLVDPSPEKIQGVVQRVINGIFRDGQLDECELTLKNLHHIAKAFTRILIAIHHHRPVYQDPKRQESKREKEKNGSSSPQPPKKTTTTNFPVATDDDKDLKRLGLD